MTNPNPNARKNIKPGLVVPANLDPEMTKFLQSVKEHLQGGDGTRGQPLARFITLEELDAIGLIKTGVKNGRGIITKLLVATPDSTESVLVSISQLTDVNVTGVQTGDVLRYNAAQSEWMTGPLLLADGSVDPDFLPEGFGAAAGGGYPPQLGYAGI